MKFIYGTKFLILTLCSLACASKTILEKRYMLLKTVIEYPDYSFESSGTNITKKRSFGSLTTYDNATSNFMKPVFQHTPVSNRTPTIFNGSYQFQPHSLLKAWQSQGMYLYRYMASILVISVSFCGNLLVIIAVGCSPRLRSTTNMFILNMAIADMMVSFYV